MTIDIRDITPGNYYNCKFKTEEMLDVRGRPINLSDTPLRGVGMYKSTGRITGRDTSTEMVEVVDFKSNKEYVVSFADIWDVKLSSKDEDVDNELIGNK